MTVATVAVQSKPHLQKALREAWRKDPVHIREQVQRFFRLAVAAAMPTLLPFLTTGKFNKVTLLAFIVPVAETAYRQMYPALGAKGVDDAQGATIVPEQVGEPTEEVPAEEAPVEADPATDALDTAPTGDFSADGTPAPPDYVVPEGDAAQ